MSASGDVPVGEGREWEWYAKTQEDRAKAAESRAAQAENVAQERAQLLASHEATLARIRQWRKQNRKQIPTDASPELAEWVRGFNFALDGIPLDGEGER